MTDQELKTVQQMQTYGGSFVKALAMAFYMADRNNFLKLKTTFSEYWDSYENDALKDNH